MKNDLAATRPAGPRPRSKPPRRPHIVVRSMRWFASAAMARPGHSAAAVLAVVGAGAFGWNTLYRQAGAHPHPLFGDDLPAKLSSAAPATPPKRPDTFALPAAAPARTDASVTASIAKAAATPKPVATDARAPEGRVVDARAAPDPIGQLIKTSSGNSSTAPDKAVANLPPEKPSVGPKVASVQKALSKLGYGKLEANGVLGAPTRTALEKFERDHKLPVTGTLGKRTVRQLAQVSGVALD